MREPFKTHGELIRELILMYENAIDEAPEEDVDNFYRFLRERRVSLGICFASLENLRVRIYGSSFLEEFTEGRYYFCATPTELMPNIGAAIESMQLRVERLQEMLPEWENIPIISEPGDYAITIK